MDTYLDRILHRHRTRARADGRALDVLIDAALSLPKPRGFAEALLSDEDQQLSVIAEIKRRSPSRGDLFAGLDPADIAVEYFAGGAACLSILTEFDHFGGSPEDLAAARTAVRVPLLRKDFTVDARDICDARLMGADAVLLIVAALDEVELADFHALADELGLDTLVEVHDEAELERALAVNACLVGVNQRNLTTFEVDPNRAVLMAPLMPSGVIRVAESGVRGPDDAQILVNAGYHAVLVGESLVTAKNRATAVRDLRKVATGPPNGG